MIFLEKLRLDDEDIGWLGFWMHQFLFDTAPCYLWIS